MEYKYRFKTEIEIIKEYGYDWLNIYNWNPLMNSLLGVVCKLKIDDLSTFSGRYSNENGNWFIDKHMLTKIDIRPNYKPKKLIYDKI